VLAIDAANASRKSTRRVQRHNPLQICLRWLRKYSLLKRRTISPEKIFMHSIADESEIPSSRSARSAQAPIANIRIAVHTFCRGLMPSLPAASVFRTKYGAFETSSNTRSNRKEFLDDLTRAVDEAVSMEHVAMIVQDNERHRGGKFTDVFRVANGILLNETAVGDRRQGHQLYQTVVNSIKDLIRQVNDNCAAAGLDEPATPSEYWIRLQFCPTNAFTKK
jgi:hypothetical protein